MNVSGIWVSRLLAAVFLAGPGLASAALLSPPAWTLDGTQDAAYLGYSVSTAGDVNGDGYSDVIVGEPYYDVFFPPRTNAGRVRIFLGGPAGVDTDPAWTVLGADEARLGHAVATAGDVNGDGYDDVLVGGYNYSNGNASEGGAWLYLGGSSGPSTTAAWSREGGQDAAFFGYSVATAGDVNGDGYDDVVIGAPFLTNQYTQQGRAYLFHGSASGLSLSPNGTFDGTGAGDALGFSVATAGDVNGDGYADVLISAVYYEGTTGPTDIGIVYCLHGGASGVDGVPDWTRTGTITNEYFGTSVSLAGDVNGDGFGDVLVGAPGYNGGQLDEGRALVYLGSAFGLGASAVRVYEWNQQDASVGQRVATAGDVNGDGYADITVAAHLYDSGQTNEGLARVYSGSATGPQSGVAAEFDSDEAGANLGYGLATAGDVNGDGYSDVIAGAPYFDAGGTNRGRVVVYHGAADTYSTVAGFAYESDQGGAEAGGSVGFADVNGDGFSDLLGSAWLYDSGQSNEGRVYCWLGDRGGVAAPADWTQEGNQTDAYFGRVIASAGDVNGDGYDDVVVTASGWDGDLADEGLASVFHGSPSGLGVAPNWSATGGEVNGAFGWAAASAGDVNGDGYGDLIVGMPNRDNPQVNEGAALLYLGSASGLGAGLAAGWEGNQDNASNGYSVACAGDVNGDGLSDMISGAPGWSNGQNAEGGAFVYFGTEGPFPSVFSQVLERNRANAGFGASVSSAGDVNGDGYSDVVVGAPTWANPDLNEGSVAVYLGSSAGLDPTPVFTYESNAWGARLGEWVASAGDVNGDGYSDIAVGAPNGAEGSTGRVYLFRGGPGGVDPNPVWSVSGVMAEEYFGRKVNGGGDVDGDGFPELAIGVPGFTNGQTGEGRMQLFYGNRVSSAFYTAGIPRQLHQRRADDSGPLALLGMSESSSSARIRVLGRSAAGRRPIRAVWEVQALGTSWTGEVERSPNWIDSGEPLPDGQGSRVGVNQPLTGLAADQVYHVRLRTECDSPFFPRTPWFSVPGNGSTEADFRTPADPSDALPAQASFSGRRLRGFEPNPVVGPAVVRLSLPGAEHARLTLHDVTGRRVAVLHEGRLTSGEHAIAWDARSDRGARLAPGVYFARLQSGGVSERAKVVVR